MNLEKINNIFFLGIGGIGMSAIARYFAFIGKNIYGYDRNSSNITNALEKENIKIIFEDNSSLINKYFDLENTLVVYTPAIPSDCNILKYFNDKNYTIYKRSEILGLITNSLKTVAVAGTHGKTTVTTMIAHILYNSVLKCNAFLGGISKNYNTNYLYSNSDYAVVEADEYDRSFLTLNPYCAVVTSIDADHLDIYGCYENIINSFIAFTEKVEKSGFIVINKKVNISINAKSITYSLNDNKADYCAENIRIIDEKFVYDLKTPKGIIENIIISVPGRINIENSIAAFAIVENLGLKSDEIKKHLESYQGVVRRFDYQIKTKDLVFIDDYAHHPEELKASISSIKELYSNKKITGIFQPHLYSRTKDFAIEFAESLSLLDELILLDIYPAREKPIEGISSEIIFDKVTINNKTLIKKENLLNFLQNKKYDVVMTIGAGDIDKFIEPIKNILLKK